jgi:hypothetical protein
MANWARRVIRVVAWVLVGVVAVITIAVIGGLLTYPRTYVYRVFAWRDSDAFDWQKFPEHRLEAAPTTYTFDKAPDERVADLFSRLAGVDDWNAFLAENQTQAFIVILQPHRSRFDRDLVLSREILHLRLDRHRH